MPTNCNCPEPPGGSVTCSDDQIAFCRVFNGKTSSGCLSPARDLGLASLADVMEVARAIATAAGLDVVNLAVRVPERGILGVRESRRFLSELEPDWRTGVRSFELVAPAALDEEGNMVEGIARLRVSLPGREQQPAGRTETPAVRAR